MTSDDLPHQVDYSIGGFSLHSTNAVSGRTLVVHEPDAAGGRRVGCGLIGSPSLGFVTLGPYPGSPPGSPLGGTLAVRSLEHMNAVHIEGLITGAALAGGWHVHTGYTCESDADVGGHLLTPGGDDPWASLAYVTTISSVPYNLAHTAHVDATVGGFTLSGGNGASSILGRAIVLENREGVPIGCGLIMPASGAEVVQIYPYPGYTPTNPLDGTHGTLFVIDQSQGGVRVFGTLAGLPSNHNGNWHVHVGSTCADAAAVGGTYFDGLSVDPWTSAAGPTYYTDASGMPPCGERPSSLSASRASECAPHH